MAGVDQGLDRSDPEEPRAALALPDAAAGLLGISSARGGRHPCRKARSLRWFTCVKAAMSTLLFKICDSAIWREAEMAGVFTGAGADLQDGYVHFSTADQVEETAARHFAGQEDLVIVAVDTAALGAALVWEPARGAALFPHLYGPLPLSAVRWVKPLPRGADGRHCFPSLRG